MNRKNVFILVITCILASVIWITTVIINTPQQKDLETYKYKPIINSVKNKTYSCPKPKKEYEDMTYLDVGQDVPLKESDYIPSDLVLVKKEISKSPICLKKEAEGELENLINDAKKENLDIIISSGFRDYDTQDMLLKNNMIQTGKKFSSSVAKPGYSEHQLGTAVDLTSKSISYASASLKFANTKEAEWLEQNSYKYGFIESYPKNKKSVTGYIYEPWHYRYIGIENALEIHNSGQTINEFLKQQDTLR